MSPTSRNREKKIRESAEQLLTQVPVSDAHNFIVSRDQACLIGEAVLTRNHKVLRDTLGGAVEQLEDDYDSFGIEDLKSEWNAELTRINGREVSVLDCVDAPDARSSLDDSLAQRDGAPKLELKPITHVKLLETIIYASAPEGLNTFNPKYATTHRYRKGKSNIHARALNTLERMCEQEPGVRQIREKLLHSDEHPLDSYFAGLSKMRLAQKAYADIIETFQSGRADAKRAEVRNLLDTSNGFNELLGTHILNWEMLPDEILESPDRNRKIKQLISERSNNRKKLQETWSDERIDVLFDTAHLASSRGRTASIYISNTFDGGSGLYLAAVLSHPLDDEKFLAVADNPLKDNALYIVDEQLTEFDQQTGKQYRWRDVLGVHKRVARARGARRRYHTGDWSELPKAVCEYGGDYKLAEQKQKAHLAESEKAVSPVSNYDGLLAAIQRAEALSRRLNIDK